MAVIEPTEKGSSCASGPAASVDDIVKATGSQLIVDGEPSEMTLN
jgi:hypothetical protein